ncbi:MAG: acyl-CoA thioesterase [Proteobacteria bacterium]|nr:acyl-CoA thioesterase [Pseudomonadota bacterium]
MNEKVGADGVDLADRDGYRFWSRDVLRFADLDPNGHVNNIAYAVFCENGRVAFRESHNPKMETGRGMETGAGTDFVIVRFAIDYIGALYYPGVVECGTRALGVGRSSYRLGQGLFGEDRCVATAESVIVCIDPETRRARPIPDGLRQSLLGGLDPAPSAGG